MSPRSSRLRGPPLRRLAARNLARNGARHRARGLTLIELVVCIALIGVVAAAMVGIFGRLIGHSADPLVQRQSLAVAESMLQEIMVQGTGSVDQSGVPDALGPEPGESRTGGGVPFDNVDDYNGLVMNGVTAVDGTAVPGLSAYSVTVSVRAQALSGVPAGSGWWVDVTVTGPDGSPVLLSGWKARLGT
jgi:MSHA pilin protein MshD